MSDDSTSKITRDDLENRFREVKSDIDERTDDAKSKAVPVAIAGGILFVILVYLIGKRVGKKRSSVVEIRRI